MATELSGKVKKFRCTAYLR